jgi:hypothetical protein
MTTVIYDSVLPRRAVSSDHDPLPTVFPHNTQAHSAHADGASVSTASRFLAWSLSVWHFSGFVTPVTLGIPWTVLFSSSECHHAAEPTTLRAEPSVPEALLGLVHAVTQCIRSLFEPSHAT